MISRNEPEKPPLKMRYWMACPNRIDDEQYKQELQAKENFSIMTASV